MAHEIELMTSNETFHDLHLLADGRKAKVKVDREALGNLLFDYSALLNALSSSVKVKCPPPKRVRETIIK